MVGHVDTFNIVIDLCGSINGISTLQLNLFNFFFLDRNSFLGFFISKEP